MPRETGLLFGLVFLALLAPLAHAASPAAHRHGLGTVTGLKLPRFVSLKSDKVNLRKGPGTRYPIAWVLQREGLPVEVLREFHTWRLVRMADGTKGWIHQALLSGRRTFMITGRAPVSLCSAPRIGSRRRAVLEPGVIGRIRHCDSQSDWCRVVAGGHEGYLPRASFWGTLVGEEVDG
jgi:SH3-like domain-containing protein